jgi:hypothetical protein
MANGRQQTFGPKDEVLSMLTRREPPPAGPFKVVSQSAAST